MPPLAQAKPAAVRTAPAARAAPPAPAPRPAAPVLPLYLQDGSRPPLPQGAVAARRELDARPAPSEQAPQEKPDEPTTATAAHDEAPQDQAAQEAAREPEEEKEGGAEQAGGEAIDAAAPGAGAQEEAPEQGEGAAPAEEGEGEEIAEAQRQAAPDTAAAPADGAGPIAREPPPPPLPIAPIPRLGGLRMPTGPDPPEAAIQRREEILARTGSTPEVHHGLVAQAVLRVVEAARTAQRDIVWRVGNLALNARMSIEDIALEVPRLVGNAIGIVRAAVRETRAAITTAADAQIAYIDANKDRINSDTTANRTQVMGDIRTHLREGSDALRKADEALQGEFDAHREEAATQIQQIPETGLFSHAGAGPPGRGRETAAAARAGRGRPAQPRGSGTAINAALIETGGKDSLLIWQDRKCADVLPANMAQRKNRDDGSRRTANKLPGEATRGEFARISFGLIAPTAAALDTDEEGDEQRVEDKADGERTRCKTVAGQAIRSIEDKRDGVMEALDRNRPKTTPFQIEKEIREAGERIQKAMRQQARAAEAGIRASAAAMADAYPDMVARVKPLLPEGQSAQFG